jgi:hypothetical protein
MNPNPVTLRTAVCLLLSSLFPFQSYGESKFANVRQLSAEWVKTQRMIAQEKGDWADEKATLQSMVKLLQEEDADLAKQIEKAKQEVTTSDLEREEKRNESDRLQNLEKSVKETLAIHEKKLLEMIEWLPSPLKDFDTNEGGISNLIEKIPTDPEASKQSMGKRLQTILAITSLIDKYNNEVWVTPGAREINGETVQVTTLYFGLAGGYYVDSEGSLAGVLKPAKGGWIEEANNELAPELAKAVAIYNKTSAEEARFFKLPVSFISTGN